MTTREQHLNVWRRLISSVPEGESRLKMFREAAFALGQRIGEELEHGQTVDDLIDLATAHSFFGLEEREVEAIIGEDLKHAADEREDNAVSERLYTEADAKAARARSKANGNDRLDPAPRALPLAFFNDLTESPSPKPWLIKGVIARDETSSWIAPPGKGKSALLTDIAVHEGGGLDWRGSHQRPLRCCVLRA
jgi:AAA domain